MPIKGKTSRKSSRGKSKKKSSSARTRRPARRTIRAAGSRRLDHAPPRRRSGVEENYGRRGERDERWGHRASRLGRYDRESERDYLDSRYGAPRRDEYGDRSFVEPEYYSDGVDDHDSSRYDRGAPPRRDRGGNGRAGGSRYKIRKHLDVSDDSEFEEDLEEAIGDDATAAGEGGDDNSPPPDSVQHKVQSRSSEESVDGVGVRGDGGDGSVSAEVNEKIDELTNQESKVSPETVLKAAGVEQEPGVGGGNGEGVARNVLFGSRGRESYGSGGDYGAALDELFEQLCSRMVHRIRSYLQDLYTRTGGDEKRFKKKLVKIQLWNQDQLNKVSRSFVIAHPDIIRYFKFAYAGKVLVMSVVVQREEHSSDVLIDSPKFVEFIHRCFIESARNFMNTSAVLAPDIPRELKIQVQRNVNKSIRSAISTALCMMVPIDSIAPAAADEEQQYKFMEDGIGDKLEELDKEVEGGEEGALDDEDDEDDIGPAELSDGGLSDESDSEEEEEEEDSEEYSDSDDEHEAGDYSDDDSDSSGDFDQGSDGRSSESEDEETSSDEELPPPPPPKKSSGKKKKSKSNRKHGKSKSSKKSKVVSDDLAFF